MLKLSRKSPVYRVNLNVQYSKEQNVDQLLLFERQQWFKLYISDYGSSVPEPLNKCPVVTMLNTSWITHCRGCYYCLVFTGNCRWWDRGCYHADSDCRKFKGWRRNYLYGHCYIRYWTSSNSHLCIKFEHWFSWRHRHKLRRCDSSNGQSSGLRGLYYIRVCYHVSIIY